MVSRRDVMVGGALAVAASPGGAPAVHAKPAAPAPPDLSFLRDTPLADADRLRAVMASAGLNALVVSHPANVLYLTNHWPQLDRMGFDGAGIAIFSRDPARPIALVMHAFLYYYTHTPESGFKDRAVFTYTQPADPAAIPPLGVEPAAQPARTLRVLDETLVSARDAYRAEMFARTRPPSADASWALAKAIKELKLDEAKLGIDEAALEGALRLRGFAGEIAPCEDVIRTARMAKSPAELKLMGYAAQANVDAALAAAARARKLGSSRKLRAEFYAEAARRGNIGHFMVISGASTETIDDTFVDGTSISIDCVSTCRFYHGDFGRTIFFGEPRKQIRDAAAAVATAWQEIRTQLRPGMRFADIPRIGRETLKKLNASDLNVSFTPHSVGLFHTDHPQPSLISPRRPDALVVQENMILSVDCPVFVAGLGGTIHLEDLMWIRSGGAQAIHTVPPPTLIV
jgi:Xaa-Pro aminopeptidase